MVDVVVLAMYATKCRRFLARSRNTIVRKVEASTDIQKVRGGREAESADMVHQNT